MTETAENGTSLWPIITFAIYWAYLVVTYRQHKRTGVKTFFNFNLFSHGNGTTHGHSFHWLADLTNRQNGLDEENFLAGAVKMYEYILVNYASGNLEALVGFLDPDVFAVFSEHIEDRKTKGERLSFDIVTLANAKIVARDFDKARSIYTVRFEADILVTTQNVGSDDCPQGSQKMLNAIDTWTVRKRKNALNKNWVLVATETD